MKRRTALVASILISASSWCAAQAAWPSRAITMIVPFPPGGLADLVARPVAEAMSRDLGQAVIIENKAGCLLYTSDAADDLLCVDLGGRRIIKKKTKTLTTTQ